MQLIAKIIKAMNDFNSFWKQYTVYDIVQLIAKIIKTLYDFDSFGKQLTVFDILVIIAKITHVRNNRKVFIKPGTFGQS